MFLRFRIFGTLAKDKPEENEDEMKYDAFFCFRLVVNHSRFSQIHNIGNNANIGIRGFTMGKQKKFSDKMLPLVGVEPLAQDSKSNMLLSTLT